MGGRGRSRNEKGSPEDVQRTLETQASCLQLRAAGATYRQIGEALQIDHTWARTLTLRALDEVKAEGVDHLRTLQGHRLDQITRSLLPDLLTAPDPAARAGTARALIRVEDRRARLYGLDYSDSLADRQLALDEGLIGMLDGLLQAVLGDAALGLTAKQRKAAGEVIPGHILRLAPEPPKAIEA